MCGITGFIDYTKTAAHEVLNAMTACLQHRGPNDEGHLVVSTQAARIALGHKRLSIIDLSVAGHQPMRFKQWTIVFNGEIYNYKEIRKELQSEGYNFDSNSDTSVILRAFEHWGSGAVDRFVGMFAFFILNEKTNKCYLFRDRVGVKPVYYSSQQSIFLFGSELKSLMRHPRFPKEIDRSALGEFFQYGYISSPRSIFTYAKKLRPGHYLEIDLLSRSISETAYWQLSDHLTPPVLHLTENEAFDQTEILLKMACNYRMVADVPVGLFLSGGYDSSLVAALLQKDRSEKIRTFTIGFDKNEFNEAAHARAIADYLGTAHTEYICNENEAKQIIPLLPEYYDEPFGDSSAIPTMLVSKLARESVTVALSADGGDEVFGGYSRYQRGMKNYRRLKKIPGLLKKLTAAAIRHFPISKLPGSKSIYRLDHYLFSLRRLLENGVRMEDLYAYSTQYLNDEEIRILLAELHPSLPVFKNQPLQLAPLTQMMFTDFNRYLPDDILVKVDRATMAVSLEGREPLLDHRLIEFVARLPEHLKIRGNEKKYLLKQIAHKHIPKNLLDRPKQGFAVPINSWLRTELTPLLDHYLNPDTIKRQHIFNSDFVHLKTKSFKDGREDYSEFIWFMLVFQMWYEKWISP